MVVVLDVDRKVMVVMSEIFLMWLWFELLRYSGAMLVTSSEFDES